MEIQVAIDGPAGAGKSTVALKVANLLHIAYVDTGAMYRCVTLEALKQGVSCHDEAALARIAESLNIAFTPCEEGQLVYLANQDVTREIRSAQIGELVSVVAKQARVREALVKRQRTIATQMTTGVVMDGRDIGTHVLPHAGVKIYLTATLETRARRRFSEMVAKGFNGTSQDVLALLRERDTADGNREVSPMRPASDAVIMDTTSLTIAEVVDMIVALCRRRMADKEAE